jgi:hypothetical protein
MDLRLFLGEMLVADHPVVEGLTASSTSQCCMALLASSVPCMQHAKKLPVTG